MISRTTAGRPHFTVLRFGDDQRTRLWPSRGTRPTNFQDLPRRPRRGYDLFYGSLTATNLRPMEAAGRKTPRGRRNMGASSSGAQFTPSRCKWSITTPPTSGSARHKARPSMRRTSTSRSSMNRRAPARAGTSYSSRRGRRQFPRRTTQSERLHARLRYYATQTISGISD